MNHSRFNRGLKGLPCVVTVLLLLCFSTRLPAQPKNDSLLATFAGLQNDSVRVDSMFKIVFKLGSTDPVLGLWLCDQAAAEPWSVSSPWARARAYNLRGVMYFSMKITDLSMNNLMVAAAIGDSYHIERIRVSSLNNIGTIQEGEGRFEEALVSYRKARAGYLKNGSKSGAILALTNVALVYMDLEQYDRALEVCDSVVKEIDNPDDVISLGNVYGLMGEIYKAKKEYPRALQMLNQSIDLAEKGGDDNARAEDLITRAEVKHYLGQDESALADLDQALKMERELGVLPFVVDCYNLFAVIAKSQGDMGLAVEWMEKSKALSDSIHKDEKATTLANYQALYDVRQKDAEIDLLNKDKEIQAANMLNVWYLFGLVSVFLLALLLILVVLVRSNRARRRINEELQWKNARILSQNEQISGQNADLNTHNEALNNLNHEMAGLLHVVAHDLKAPLSQVGGIVAALGEAGPLNPAQEKMISMAKSVTLNASNLVQDLVEFGSAGHQDAPLHKVSVPMVAFVGEVASSFAADAARKSITIETAFPEVEVEVFTAPDQLRRVLENLVSNALKFSPIGKRVFLAISIDEGQACIAIRDQGPGISPADQKNLYRKFHKLSARPTGGESSSGLGLAIVKTLLQRLGGEISLESELGVGSTFTIRIPMR